MESLKDKLENNDVYNEVRQKLYDELYRVNAIYPDGQYYHYDTKHVDVNNVITFPHIEYCRDDGLPRSQDPQCLPIPGGYLLVKWRRAVVFEKYKSDLKVRIFTTFSRTPMESKRQRKVFDEVKGTEVLELSDYVHIVARDHHGTSQDYPACFSNGLPVFYRCKPGCQPGDVKDSFMNPNAEYVVSSGTPLLIVGEIEDSVSVRTLDLAWEAVVERTRVARSRALKKLHAAEHNEAERDEAQRAKRQAAEAEVAEFRRPRFTEDLYDDAGMQPSTKKLKREVDLDAPEPPKNCLPNGWPSMPNNLAVNGTQPDAQPPFTALDGLNFDIVPAGKSANPHADQKSPKALRKE